MKKNKKIQKCYDSFLSDIGDGDCFTGGDRGFDAEE
jgi:hypothetical protein